MIILQNLFLAFGKQIVFDDITRTIQQTDRVGLFGLNGSGKSTLLKAIAGLQSLDGGIIRCARGKTIAYMPQEVTLASDSSIIDETMRAFLILQQIANQLLIIEQQSIAAPDNQAFIEEYANLCQQHALQEPVKKRAMAERMLTGLGFSETEFDKPIQALSVGWKMRIVLAKLLLQDADFYLFDEPTNHLDIVAKEWFLRFLETASFGFLLVCHEKRFLNRLCSHIFELDNGKGTIYTGSYDAYVTQKTAARERLELAYANQQRDIARKQATIDRFRAKSSKARMAQSMEKQLAKVERIELPREHTVMRFPLPPLQKPGSIVLTVHNLQYAFTKTPIFRNVSFAIERGYKVAIVAPNGVGKTTLLNLISGRFPLQAGRIEQGYQVSVALFDQDQTISLDLKRSVFDNAMANAHHQSEQAVRSMLGAFLFGAESIHKRAEVLSGGERNRLGMVRTLLQGANMLLLDEPTNHLDIPSKDVLLDALQRYTGSLLFVSHDHDFVNNLATHIIILTPEGAELYPGTYDEYLYQKQMTTAVHKAATGDEPISTRAMQSGNVPVIGIKEGLKNRSIDKKIRVLEQKIARLEQEILQYEASFAELVYGTPAFVTRAEQLEACKKQLAYAMQEWELCHE
jgi:ATP-binding cassette, subfamily F, member 3